MLGLTDYVVVIVVNAALNENKKPTDFFTTANTTMVSATNSVFQSMGNQHARTNIQKQAYPSDRVKNVRQAYGLTGTNFNTHTPYINGIYDPKMGPSNNIRCTLCKFTRRQCPGHYGRVELEYPIKVPILIDELPKWLSIVCHYCSSPVLQITSN